MRKNVHMTDSFQNVVSILHEYTLILYRDIKYYIPEHEMGFGSGACEGINVSELIQEPAPCES